MRRVLNRAKGLIRPIQRRALFPVRNALRLGKWQSTRRGAIVVNYHGVEPAIHDRAMQAFCLTADELRASLRTILEHHEIVPLDRIMEALEGEGPVPSHWAALSFDDGYVNTLTVARPVLHEFGDLPATVFVCPGLIEQRAWMQEARLRLCVLHGPKQRVRIETLEAEFHLGSRGARLAVLDRVSALTADFDPRRREAVTAEWVATLPQELLDRLRSRFASEQLVNWEQLRRLADEPNIVIGGHTTHHVSLHPRQSHEIVEREVQTCRQMLEEKLDKPVLQFAYPGGANGPAAHQAVADAGYRAAWTIEPHEVVPGTHPFLLPRVTSSQHQAVMRRTLACAGMGGAAGWWW